jgi:hypothetical protein
VNGGEEKAEVGRQQHKSLKQRPRTPYQHQHQTASRVLLLQENSMMPSSRIKRIHCRARSNPQSQLSQICRVQTVSLLRYLSFQSQHPQPLLLPCLHCKTKAQRSGKKPTTPHLSVYTCSVRMRLAFKSALL